jgi:hypothetical protein
MQKIKNRAEFDIAHKEGYATYEQCQLIYALSIKAGMQPCWAETCPYGTAIKIITTLRNYLDD